MNNEPGKRLKLGIVGLGEVAQIIHLPILQTMRDRYELAAFCDISPMLLNEVGKLYGMKHLFDSTEEMIRQTELDAIFVLNSNEYHAECTLAAIKHKLHVFVEKPMCMTQREADSIIEARDEAGVQVMVGYMRRFAPAFQQAVEEVSRLDRIVYARIRDIIGLNRFFIDQTSQVLRFSDISESAILERKEKGAGLMREAIGEVSDDLYSAYNLLLGLSSHDISAMRELIGMPKAVRGASGWLGGRFINALLEFDGFHAFFETGIDRQGIFDAHLQVYGEKKSVLVKYDTPYIRHMPTTLHILETHGESFREINVRPTYKDAYICELEYFYDVVTQGISPKTSPEDFKQDLTIFKMIIEAMNK